MTIVCWGGVSTRELDAEKDFYAPVWRGIASLLESVKGCRHPEISWPSSFNILTAVFHQEYLAYSFTHRHWMPSRTQEPTHTIYLLEFDKGTNHSDTSFGKAFYEPTNFKRIHKFPLGISPVHINFIMGNIKNYFFQLRACHLQSVIQI